MFKASQIFAAPIFVISISFAALHKSLQEIRLSFTYFIILSWMSGLIFFAGFTGFSFGLYPKSPSWHLQSLISSLSANFPITKGFF